MEEFIEYEKKYEIVKSVSETESLDKVNIEGYICKVNRKYGLCHIYMLPKHRNISKGKLVAIVCTIDNLYRIMEASQTTTFRNGLAVSFE